MRPLYASVIDYARTLSMCDRLDAYFRPPTTRGTDVPVVSESEFYTLEELSAYLRVSEPTLRRWRANGEGPVAAKVGRQLRYSHADVQTWLEQQKDTGDR
jgi:excisionase family DNA binding protein